MPAAALIPSDAATRESSEAKIPPSFAMHSKFDRLWVDILFYKISTQKKPVRQWCYSQNTIITVDCVFILIYKINYRRREHTLESPIYFSQEDGRHERAFRQAKRYCAAPGRSFPCEPGRRGWFSFDQPYLPRAKRHVAPDSPRRLRPMVPPPWRPGGRPGRFCGPDGAGDRRPRYSERVLGVGFRAARIQAPLGAPVSLHALARGAAGECRSRRGGYAL
jgi:hypothetical protein